MKGGRTLIEKCLLIVKRTMDKSIRQSIPKTKNTKIFLKEIADEFTKVEKVKKFAYMKMLASTEYDGISGVREHIIKLTTYYTKLKEMNFMI